MSDVDLKGHVLGDDGRCVICGVGLYRKLAHLNACSHLGRDFDRPMNSKWDEFTAGLKAQGIDVEAEIIKRTRSPIVSCEQVRARRAQRSAFR